MRALLAAATLGAAVVFNGPATLAQQADPQAQLDSINAQKDLWQRKLDQAKGQINVSSNSLAAAKAKLAQTKASLSTTQTQAQALQANNPKQIDQLKQDLVAAQAELDGIIKDTTDRQNKLISDLGANQQLIDETTGQIQATGQQMDYTNKRLADLANDIIHIQADQAATQGELDVVLRATYKEQRRSLLEFLLQSLSFGDFLTRVSNLQSVAGQQDHLLTMLKLEDQQLEDTQAEQRDQMNTLLDLQDAQQAQKQTLDLQRQNFNDLLEQARVEAQEGNVRISAREDQVQAAIDQKQGELDQNQRLLKQLKDAQSQLSSTINNQSDVLTKAQQQEQAARTQLDQLEKEAEGVAAIIAQAEALNPSKTYASGGLAWPMRGAMMQGFGPSPYGFEPSITYQGKRYAHFHTGIDIATAYGTPIRAAADGQVISTGYSSWGYGNNIIIAHNPKLATLYAHMSKLAVSNGAVVKQGQIIGYEGSTGNSTGPHLHFEVRIDGQFVNPLGYL
jgi:murein DD-endopeptidase MepM/ murein hydrolase activator NlpD